MRPEEHMYSLGGGGGRPGGWVLLGQDAGLTYYRGRGGGVT